MQMAEMGRCVTAFGLLRWTELYAGAAAWIQNANLAGAKARAAGGVVNRILLI